MVNNEESEKSALAQQILLDTSIGESLDGQRNRQRMFNFEIQLPSRSEFCIDWKQKDYPNPPDAVFSNNQWEFDEVARWVDEGGESTFVEGEETGLLIDRSELERDLLKLGLSLEEIAAEYYPLALQAGRKGYIKRGWHS